MNFNFERLDMILNHHMPIIELEKEILWLISEHLEKQDGFYIKNKEAYDRQGPGFWLYIPSVKDAKQAVYNGCDMNNLVYIPITDKVLKPHVSPAINTIRSIVYEDPDYNPSMKGIIMMYASSPYSDKNYMNSWCILKKV